MVTSLAQWCCGEGETLQTNITGMCGECSQCFSCTGFTPAHGVCTFIVYTAQAPGCSAWELSEVGPGLRALSRCKLLRFRFLSTPQRRRLSWVCVLCPSQVRAAQVTRCLASVVTETYCLPHSRHSVFWVYNGHAFSGVLCVYSGELVSCCDPPSRCRSSRIPRSLG